MTDVPVPEAPSSSSSLRPLTLGAESHLLPSFQALSQLRNRLEALHLQSQHYDKLVLKLETITDQPIWDAYIPFGSLAFFPGKLVHTNDVTETTLPTTQQINTSEPSSSTSTSRLLSAKQARLSVALKKQETEKEIVEVQQEIEKQRLELSKQHAARIAGATERGQPDDQSWTFNERGEVINDEGLPVFDIREELPPEPAPEVVDTPSIKGKEKEQDQPKMRYLIKKGGKQIVRPLNPPPTTPTSKMRTSPGAKSANKVALAPTASNEISLSTIDTKAILDALEAEEEAEAPKTEPSAPATDELASIVPNTEPTTAASESSPSSAPNPSSPTKLNTSPIPTPALSTSKPKEFLSGFSSGFLKTKPKAKSASTPTPNLTPTVTMATSTTLPGSPPSHEPLHHSLEPTKSIYRPTPPGTPLQTPTPRSSSPTHLTNGNKKSVMFNLPEGEKQPERETKRRKEAIILPPPPAPSVGSASLTEGDDRNPKNKREEFVRPIKEKVIEREVKPPSLPGLKKRVLKKDEGDRNGTKTVGKAPKSIEEPIHTISLNASKSKGPGTATLEEIFGQDDEEEGEEGDDQDEDESKPGLIPDDSDSSSSGFYASDDDEEEEEFDIDTALHHREIALAYHAQRQGLGAGIGTGPLGGQSDPNAYDAWDQENVPVEATLQGRQAGTNQSSRFRNGRLEATRMIIPDLLAKHVKHDDRNEQSEDEDDGMTEQERDRVRIALEKLSRGESLEGMFASENQEIDKEQDKQEENNEEALKGVVERVPPKVKEVSMPKPTPVAAPSLPKTTSAIPSSPSAPGEKPKKMSRFKARQLGLEQEES